jgi:hypothetical protein
MAVDISVPVPDEEITSSASILLPPPFDAEGNSIDIHTVLSCLRKLPARKPGNWRRLFDDRDDWLVGLNNEEFAWVWSLADYAMLDGTATALGLEALARQILNGKGSLNYRQPFLAEEQTITVTRLMHPHHVDVLQQSIATQDSTEATNLDRSLDLELFVGGIRSAERLLSTRTNSGTLSVHSMCKAAQRPLHVVKWLQAIGCPWVTSANHELNPLRAAAQCGNEEVFKWLVLCGCEIDGSIAAQAHNLRMLKFVRSQGCPWDGRVYENVARLGDLDMLRFARDIAKPLPS